MVEYTIGRADEKDEIVDFINYVFSFSHQPHNFKTLLPKSYADDADGLGAIHYLAKKDGKIKAMVANRIIDVTFCGNTLKYGLIGNVSVHPYSRGEGFMKKLMTTAVEEAKQNGIDALVLGGQRQRYGYFGFENAGANYVFTISKTNIRHCFPDVDDSGITLHPLTEENPEEVDTAKALYEKNIFHALRDRAEFIHIMHSWNKECRVICKNGEMIGYTYGNLDELVLKDESDFPAVLKGIFRLDNLTQIELTVAPFMKERVESLVKICEVYSIACVEMINVICWERVLKTLLELKSTYTSLTDGSAELKIDGVGYRITVAGGVPSVEETDVDDTNAIILSHNGAIQAFFGITSLMTPDERLKNWAPLPFEIDVPDRY